jgi:hypothetical protein
MISLEMAKKLQAAGLNNVYTDRGAFYTINYDLSQLLSEIEAQGWKCNLNCRIGEYEIVIFRGEIEVDYEKHAFETDLPGDTPEEAAAAALLWIYQQKRDTDPAYCFDCPNPCGKGERA